MFQCHNPQGINFLTRLCLGLSHFHEHKFKHIFQDSLNPLCKCGFDNKSTSHFLVYCHIYKNGQSSLLSTVKNIDLFEKFRNYEKLLENTSSSLTQRLLYGNSSLDSNTNLLLLKAIFDFILSRSPF